MRKFLNILWKSGERVNKGLEVTGSPLRTRGLACGQIVDNLSVTKPFHCAGSGMDMNQLG